MNSISGYNNTGIQAVGRQVLDGMESIAEQTLHICTTSGMLHYAELCHRGHPSELIFSTYVLLRSVRKARVDLVY